MCVATSQLQFEVETPQKQSDPGTSLSSLPLLFVSWAANLCIRLTVGRVSYTHATLQRCKQPRRLGVCISRSHTQNAALQHLPAGLRGGVGVFICALEHNVWLIWITALFALAPLALFVSLIHSSFSLVETLRNFEQFLHTPQFLCSISSWDGHGSSIIYAVLGIGY